ncbi:vacuolar protein sorting-associated protein 37C [Hippocampus comes]|uniref:VPS37C subunit of ESCRT-I n=1 Tax=Hippocampus comes TaxID=109280 RepID=A0A3Q2YHA9_HIPCM|nr:PREDICTED: vacuolar protein sorting-associated protein 37C-like [Hippocampus comes]
MEKILDLSQSELHELLDHPEKVASMAHESDEIQNIHLEREMALASNRSLAEQNLAMRPDLESRREVLVERYLQLEAIRETYKEHHAIIDGMIGQVSPEAFFSRLQTEGKKAEAESEVLADIFLEGSLPLDSFLDRFLPLRSLAHKRRVRIEKFQEVMRQTREDKPTATSSSPGIIQGPQVNHWNPQIATAANQQHQANNKCQTSSYYNASQPLPSSAGASCGVPYLQCPSSPSCTPPPVALLATGTGPVLPSSQVVSSAGLPFAPAGSCTGPRPAFRPMASVPCPYPTQSSFSAPNPGSAFGQYTRNHPQSNTAVYAASYRDGGYNYPASSAHYNSQSPTERPICRPGNGVPQPYF